MIVRNRTCHLKVKALDPSKTEILFLLLFSNLRSTSIFKTSLMGIGHICLPEVSEGSIAICGTQVVQ
jgi:hypothetical protein